MGIGCTKGQTDGGGRYGPSGKPKDPFEKIDGEKCTFGMNTLWNAEAKMGRAPGVIRTRVGYMGGIEVVEVEYDKLATNYDEILKTFWQSHDRCGQYEREHLSVIFYHNKEQKIAAEVSFLNEIPKWNESVLTQILAADTFQPADSSQQKYFLQRHNELLDMLKLQPGVQLMRSHLACVINGFMGGFGTLDQFDAACEKLRLPENIVTYIRNKIEDMNEADVTIRGH